MHELFEALLIALLACAGLSLFFANLRMRRDSAKEAESLRLRSWREFDGLVASITDAVIVVDDQGCVVGWNAGAGRMFGWEADEVLMLPLPAALFTDESRGAIERHLRQLAESGTSEYVGAPTRLHLVHRGGTPVTCEATVTQWLRDGRHFTGTVLRDVTSREAAETELRRLALAVEHAHESIVITGADATIQYVNPAFERVTGYRREQVLGGKPSLLKSGHQSDAFYRDMWTQLARGDVWTGTFVNRRADGSYFEEEATISPVRDESGTLRNYVAVKRDVTQERALERQLRQSQKLEAVGQLAAGIAHEINTPLQYAGDSARYLSNCIGGVMHAIGAYEALVTELQAQPELADRLAELAQVREDADLEFAVAQIPLAVQRIEDAIVRVSVIVRAMKEFAHPGVHDVTAADLNHMLETTLTVARNEYKGVADVETHFGMLPPVPCHVSELNQAFLNIVVNAGHAIAERASRNGGRGTIRVSTRAEGDFVVVEFEDDGCGIPESIKSRVFDPFFTTKAVGKGTGQGMSIARSIVMERHGGALTLRSEEGRGTTFTVRLPVHRERALEQAA